MVWWAGAAGPEHGEASAFWDDTDWGSGPQTGGGFVWLLGIPVLELKHARKPTFMFWTPA